MLDGKIVKDTTLTGIETYAKAASDPVMAAIEEYRMVYPEIFYKLQPYIMMVCDQMDAYGNSVPNQDMMEQITDGIYRDMLEMYPDLVEYVREQESRETGAVETITRSPGRFGRRFRRRGVFRDLIDILFLSEFLGRRRRRFY
jgi:FMN phosphatase YigB (HAD superfamily)